MTEFGRVYERRKLRVNVGTSKVMRCSRYGNVGRIHMILNGEPLQKDKNGKVFYGQEPPSGESTTTECGVNYQLLAVITEVAHWRTPSCSQPQPATYSGVRDGRSK